MKTKILHVIGGLNAAGAETAVMNWLRNIDREKYQFDFAIHTKDVFYLKEAEKLGCRIFYLPNPKTKGLKKWIESFEKLLSEEKYQIVHSHLYFFNGIVLRSASKKRVPIRISHSHNEGSEKSKNILKSVYKIYSRYLIKKYATILLGCSRGSFKNLYSNISANDKRLVVLHYGIDLLKFKRKIDKKNLRKKYKLPINSRIYLHIGRFTPAKNHLFLIKIFKEILKKEPSSTLILIGDGKLREEIEKMVELVGIDKNVRLVGKTDKIPQWMQLSDLIIFPSLYEGLPVTLIEAQACGLNCLVSKNVSEEIDAQINLVKFFSLQKSAKKWAQKALSIKNKTTDKQIDLAIKKHEFDILSVSEKLEKIYDRPGKK